MTATHGLGTYGNAVGTVTPLDHKMAQLGLVVKTAANTIRAGLSWDGSSTVVTGHTNMSYNVRAFSAVLSRGATAGCVLLTNDATFNVATTAAPGSNSRYDVVYVWAREFSIDGVDSNPVIGVVQGTAAASPSVPSLASFPGAIELARILVPAGVTATNSGTTITQTAPFTANSGGTVLVRTTTERDAGSWIEGQQIYVLNTDQIQVYDGSGWLNVYSPWSTFSPTAGGGFTVGNGSLTGRYQQIGKSVKFKIFFTAGSTSSFSGTFTFTLPVTSVGSDVSGTPYGNAFLQDASVGTGSRRSGTVMRATASNEVYVVVDSIASSGLVNNTVPWTWANGDDLFLSGEYEAA